MLRLLADENFNNSIVRVLLQRQPDLDLVRVQDVGLREAEDPEVLAWAAANGRIVLTHDKATMVNHACDRLAAGQPMPGLFVLPDPQDVAGGVDDVLEVVLCSAQAEWDGRVVYLPV